MVMVGIMKSSSKQKTKPKHIQETLFGICEFCEEETEECNPIACDRYYNIVKEQLEQNKKML